MASKLFSRLRKAAGPLASTMALVGAAAAPSPAAAAIGDDTFYLGVGLGQSTLENEAFDFSHHATGWTVLGGYRPIKYVSAEIGYVSLGSSRLAGPDCSTAVCFSNTAVSTRGETAFGVLYLPIPRFPVEFYGKAGVARLQNRASSVVTPHCSPNQTCPDTISDEASDVTHSGFAWAAGAQLHNDHVGLRVEFEDFDSGTDRPRLLSVGLLWAF